MCSSRKAEFVSYFFPIGVEAGREIEARLMAADSNGRSDEGHRVPAKNRGESAGGPALERFERPAHRAGRNCRFPKALEPGIARLPAKRFFELRLEISAIRDARRIGLITRIFCPFGVAHDFGQTGELPIRADREREVRVGC